MKQRKSNDTFWHRLVLFLLIAVIILSTVVIKQQFDIRDKEILTYYQIGLPRIKDETNPVEPSRNDYETIIAAEYYSLIPNYCYETEDYEVVHVLLGILKNASFQKHRRIKSWDGEAICFTTEDHIRELHQYSICVNGNVLVITVDGNSEFYSCSLGGVFQNTLQYYQIDLYEESN